MIKANIKMLVLYTSEHKNDTSLNLIGVKNAIQQLDNSLKSNVKLDIISNKNSTEAKNEIIKYFEKQKFTESDIFVFYYCGHGFLTGRNMDNLILATSDTTKTNSYAEVGINFDWLISEIKQAFKYPQKKKYVVVLDCCHSAAAKSMGVSWNHKIDLQNYSGATIITSTKEVLENSKTVPINGIEYAAFTYYFSYAFSELMKTSKTFSLSTLMERIEELIKKHNNESDTILPLPKIYSEGQLEQNIIFSKTLKSFESVFPVNENKLKVLLVKTSIDFPVKNYDFGVPLGLWLIKSYMFIQGLDIQIDIYDERLMQVKGCALDFEEIVTNYDVVGVSICSCEVPNAIKKLSFAKKHGVYTFVGGIFVATNEEYLFKQECIDYIVPGVSTLPLYNLFKEMQKLKDTNQLNKKNLISHIDGVATKENLSSSFSLWVPCQLPYIELNIWREIVELYGEHLNNKIDIFTTRGCNKHCAFCSVQKECNQKILERDDESIIDEIDFLYNYGFRHFSIKDEDFFISGTDRLVQIIEKCHNKHPEITFKIRARIDEIMSSQTTTLKKLYSLGVREIQYGLESPERSLLDKIKKGHCYKKNEMIKIIQETIQTGIVANCSFIFGIEGENSEYYDYLLQFFEMLECEKSMLKIYINFFTPHPYKNSFASGDYTLVSNDLKYYNHKLPIAFPKNMRRLTRVKMLDVYKKVVEKFDPNNLYNLKIEKDIEESFINGITTNKSLPQYYKGDGSYDF